MLTKGDDFPLHQSSEPIAFSGTDRNFYDRYFFNGYSPDGQIFFAAAMGFYPQLGVIDASFCVVIGGVQYNLRASRRSGGERLDLSVGPIRIEVDAPLERLRLRIAENEGPLTADLLFTGRHFPIEEPRFIRRNGTRLFMDYTRLTQNGHWQGWFSVKGERQDLSTPWAGTRDRSWGIRPIGAPESQPPPAGNFSQFFWSWTPCNFDGASLFFHSNDDAAGEAWNRRAVIVSDDGKEVHFDQPQFQIQWQKGTRRAEILEVEIGGGHHLRLLPDGPIFAMSGLGYTHPAWGHGLDHGDKLEVAFDELSEGERAWGNPLALHIQQLVRAEWNGPLGQQIGRGISEQLFVGPHGPSGLTGLMDPIS